MSKKLVGHYDQSSGLAVLVHGGMTIEFDYVGPNTRPGSKQAIVKITCNGPEFKALESYPETLCGEKNKERETERGGGEKERSERRLSLIHI